MKRAGMLFYFHMPDDGNGACRKEWLAFAPRRSEGPVAFFHYVEVAPLGPVCPLVGMTSSCPVPDGAKHLHIDPFVDLFGDDVPMEQGPPSNDRIEFLDQVLLGCRLMGSYNVLDLRQKGSHILSCGGCEILLPVPILSVMLAEEVEPFLNVCDEGLLFREFQTPFFEKGFHHRPDLLFEELFGRSCYHEVVGEPCHVDSALWKSGFELTLEPIERHITERGGDNPALGCPGNGGEKASTVDKP